MKYNKLLLLLQQFKQQFQNAEVNLNPPTFCVYIN